jgi:hypothetical protein
MTFIGFIIGIILFLIVIYLRFDIIKVDKLPIREYGERGSESCFRELLILYMERFEESKDLWWIERKCHKYYKKIPEKYRYIDIENIGYKDPLPYWIESLLLYIKNPFIWVIFIIYCMGIIFILNFSITMMIQRPTLLHNEKILYVSNFTEIYNCALTDKGIQYIKDLASNYKKYDYINKIHSIGNDYLLEKERYIYQKAWITNKSYLNLTALEQFLLNWQKTSIKVENILHELSYCFCPIFLGITNPIHFIYNENDKKWKFLFNPIIIENDNWSQNKLTKTLITYPINNDLYYLNRNLTNHQSIEHSKTLLISFDSYSKDLNNTIIKEQQKIILYFKDTACYVHCKTIIKN